MRELWGTRSIHGREILSAREVWKTRGPALRLSPCLVRRRTGWLLPSGLHTPLWEMLPSSNMKPQNTGMSCRGQKGLFPLPFSVPAKAPVTKGSVTREADTWTSCGLHVP